MNNPPPSAGSEKKNLTKKQTKYKTNKNMSTFK
jgi:hypothetical protein